MEQIDAQRSASQQAAQKKEAEQAILMQLQLSEDLFKYAMTDQWQEVVEAYETKPDSQKAKITDAEDTALHLAVSGGKLEVVYKLVETLGGNASDVLRAKNKRGNTPLHTAAALGYAQMCHCMASKDHTLIFERNEKNQNPFHLAAQFGHKRAFFCLYFCYQGNRSELCSRDSSGNTILHAAIQGEHFDLAFQIICKYPGLVNDFNEDGLSPLHILATKTNAFNSASRLGLLDRFLYRCVIVDEAKEKNYDGVDYLKRFEENCSGRPCFPQNYDTCVRFFRMTGGVVFYGMPIGGSRFVSYFKHDKKKNGGSKNDEENPDRTSKVTHQGESSSSQSKSKSDDSSGAPKTEEKVESKNGLNREEEHKGGYLPANYATFAQFFKYLMKFMLVVFGLGFQRIRRITAKKQRHIWATQVMNKLIDHNDSMYKYSGRHMGRGTGSGSGELSEDSDLPFHPSQMSSSCQDTCADASKKEGNAAMVENFLGEYSITGTVESKTSKHALKMKFEKKVAKESTKPKRPILIAASNGITEIVEKILEKFPVAIQDVDAENKNVLLLAVENRQTRTFLFLIERKFLHESVFRQVDNQGNSALHLAATYGHYRPWLIPGSALQMQWELKWYKFVKKSMAKHLLVHYNKKSMAKHLLVHYNNKNQTPKQIFIKTHKALVKDGSEWLTKTSESCSLIAALIATVAFATAANIPGGVSQNTGEPVLRDEPAFGVFAVSSLIALCFSVTALVFFLAILTSRFEEKEFAVELPRKLILGLTSLFTSIAAILVSFCAGHFFELRDELKYPALFPMYAAACLPISFFALAQLPLYFDLLWAIYKKVPERGYKEFAS